jgi:hypothetical protein
MSSTVAVQYVGGTSGLFLPDIGATVDPGTVIEVSEAFAEGLLAQVDIWVPADGSGLDVGGQGQAGDTGADEGADMIQAAEVAATDTGTDEPQGSDLA